jgi:outer membrane protein assembly factor BamD (BamD/ComL family)
VARQQKKLTRKEIKEDKIAEFLLAAVNYARRNSRKLTGVVIGILIILLVFTIARRQRAAAELEAQSMLARTNLDLQQGNFSSALQGYRDILDRFRGTWGHSDAVFLSADANFATGRYDSAMVFFESYLNLNKRRETFTVSAKIGVAQCLEQMGRFADAAESYLKVQREHSADPFAPDALFGAARCYELLKDLPKAEAAYKDLIERYPKSRQANLAKMPLLEIQAQLEKT